MKSPGKISQLTVPITKFNCIISERIAATFRSPTHLPEGRVAILQGWGVMIHRVGE